MRWSLSDGRGEDRANVRRSCMQTKDMMQHGVDKRAGNGGLHPGLHGVGLNPHSGWVDIVGLWSGRCLG